IMQAFEGFSDERHGQVTSQKKNIMLPDDVLMRQNPKWTGGANNSPDSSYPDVSANGWTITTPNNGSSTSCFVSVASCTRL
ncbi:hypothetical protein ACFFJN_04190, partial [Erwinia mallotivora]